jgi:hypothetical protein
MSQATTHIPNTKPTTGTQHLRITPTPPCHRPPSAPSHAAGPKPQADSPLERFLSLYLDETLTLADIAFTLGLSITETLARTTEPDFLKLLETYTAAQDKRAEVLARANRATAARTFSRLAETCDKPETARKAAGEIIRMQAKSQPDRVTNEHRIAAASVFAKRPVPSVRELLTPILGPATPKPSTA